MSTTCLVCKGGCTKNYVNNAKGKLLVIGRNITSNQLRPYKILAASSEFLYEQQQSAHGLLR